MNDKKIKILVISLDSDGVGYYRINSPYLALNDPDIDVKLVTNSDFSFRFNEETLKDFNIIVYHKGIPFRDKSEMENFAGIINKYNIKIVYEIDDHWILDSSHINYAQWKKGDSQKTTMSQIKHSHFVTTTTPIFADDIRQLNPNVIVFENAVNHKEYQWISRKKESEKTRFIWGGGITHQPDLMLLKDSFKMFDKKFLNENQVYMCGYDLRVRTQHGVYLDNSRRSMWGKFEDIFTNNGKNIINSEHRLWLNENDDNGRLNYGYNEKYKNEFYQRRWTKPIFTYGTMYNEADVALAPLKSNVLFNKVKSQLKIIEAGAHKCPVIASNYGPYTIDIVNGKHGFLIDGNDISGWYNKMKWFSENPSAIKEMGEALHELVMEKYTLEKINKTRAEFFKAIVN
jgi:glycosyltransferase involved in cell wall biosynthesis